MSPAPMYLSLDSLLQDPRYTSGSVEIRCNSNGRFSIVVKLDDDRVCYKTGMLNVQSCMEEAEKAAESLLAL